MKRSRSHKAGIALVIVGLLLSGPAAAGSVAHRWAEATGAHDHGGDEHQGKGSAHNHESAEAMLSEAQSLGVTDLRIDPACDGLLMTGNGACTPGPDPLPPGLSSSDVTPPQPPRRPVALPCVGNGTSGDRVEVIYVNAAGTTNRYGTYLASIRSWVDTIDSIVTASAAQTGGTRSVRFVQDGSCNAVVRNETLAADTLGDYEKTWDSLAAKGYTRADRKYLIYADWSADYCGIGELSPDESPGYGNRSNTGGSFALATQPCWDESTYATATHELFHTLGAVQDGAPNSTEAGHCFDGTLDGADVMCYAENGYSAYDRCSTAGPVQLDCGKDDYFNTAPGSGTYLASHWNTANNKFLIGAPGPPPPPPNDAFSAATAIAVCGPRTVTGSSDTATVESGEPLHAGQKGRSAWWSWYAAKTGTVSVTTAGSSYDTVLAVYRGAALGSLTTVAENDDSGGYTSAVSFTAQAGTTYRIAVDGYGGSGGSIQLNLSGAVQASPLADCFSAPQAISTPGRYASTSTYATTETGEPGSGGASLWYEFVPDRTGIWVIDSIGSTYDTLLNAYTGTALTGLTSVAADDDGGSATTRSSRIQQTFTAGTRYRIRLAGKGNAKGNAVLNVGIAGRHQDLTPHRALDSRTGIGGPSGRWPANSNRDVRVAGIGGVPANATSVTMAVSVVDPTSAGFGRVWPTGTIEPSATVTNWTKDASLTNTVVVRPGTDGKVTIRAAQAGTTHVVVDLLGYDVAGPGGEYVGTNPTRAVDSRSGLGTSATPWSVGEERTIALAGAPGLPIPSSATAVAVSFSVTGPTGGGFARIASVDAATTPATVLNWQKGASRTGYAITSLASDGSASVFVGGSSTHVVIDVLGYYLPDSVGDGNVFVAITPTRAFDTRGTARVGSLACRTVPTENNAGLPGGDIVALLSVSAVDPTGTGFLRLVGANPSAFATVINYQAAKSISNHAAFPAPNGSVDACAYTSSTHVVVDAMGYFVAD